MCRPAARRPENARSRVDSAQNGKDRLQMTHVDIVKNEWLAGHQVVVGRVWTEGGELHLDASAPEIEALIGRYRDLPAAGTAEDFVASLHDTLRGDYLFATELHAE